MNRSRTAALLSTAATAVLLTACMEGEGGGEAPAGEADVLRIDHAHYNIAGLVVRDQGLLEDALAEQGVDVEWVFSDGSNKANENLRAETIDIGSTAGTPALLARANGTPIQVVEVYSQPEWSAIVAAEGSDITGSEDLAGATVAATAGTDPYFFLLQTLDEAGIGLDEIEHADLQHADGRRALENGDVDAWAGLDPHMAASELESGSELIHRDLDFNSFGTLNAREDFVENEPEVVQTVVDAFGQARAWVRENPDEAAELLAAEADIDSEVARRQLEERTLLDHDPVPGPELAEALERVSPYLVEHDLVRSRDEVDQALGSLFAPGFAENAADGAGEDAADGRTGNGDGGGDDR